MVSVLMIGTGEYTTGFIDSLGDGNQTDKGAGVVALTMFDLRKRGKTQRLGLCGVDGFKFPRIRQHMKAKIQDVYRDIDDIHVETFPRDDEKDSKSYLRALDSFQRGDAVIVFTPDDTHFEIALAAINRGMHVLITKPLVKTLREHQLLDEAAKRNGVFVMTEVHKRFDPMYVDARDKLIASGPCSYFYSYMSQPKYQLKTFKAWAGKSSDISYYLNAHHIDFHEWFAGDTSRPVSVVAIASTGVANAICERNCEDTITLTVQWENLDTTTTTTKGQQQQQQATIGLATAIYTSSWIAPSSDVHSQQRFFCMTHRGEVNIDQAHRGYTFAQDNNNNNNGSSFKSVNPLFMKYTPSDGRFAGQQGYGYRSLESFIDVVHSIQQGTVSVDDFRNNNNNNNHDAHGLATINSTFRTTAILEAGRLSLDNNNKTVFIRYDDLLQPTLPTDVVVADAVH